MSKTRWVLFRRYPEVLCFGCGCAWVWIREQHGRTREMGCVGCNNPWTRRVRRFEVVPDAAS